VLFLKINGKSELARGFQGKTRLSCDWLDAAPNTTFRQNVGDLDRPPQSTSNESDRRGKTGRPNRFELNRSTSNATS
jgi:hypothetical protein